MGICGAVGIGLAYTIATFDALIYFHAMHADYGDPNHPGRLKGVLVTPGELIGKTLLAVLLLGAAIGFWRFLAKSGKG